MQQRAQSECAGTKGHRQCGQGTASRRANPGLRFGRHSDGGHLEEGDEPKVPQAFVGRVPQAHFTRAHRARGEQETAVSATLLAGGTETQESHIMKLMQKTHKRNTERNFSACTLHLFGVHFQFLFSPCSFQRFSFSIVYHVSKGTDLTASSNLLFSFLLEISIRKRRRRRR